MTGAQFCLGFTAVPVQPQIGTLCELAVVLEYSIAGEAPERATVVVQARSEAAAIRGAIVEKVGSVKRKLHSIQVLSVHRLRALE